MSENSADTIKQLAIQAAGQIAQQSFDDGRQMLIHPPGFIVKDVSLPQNVKPPVPTYIKQNVEVQTKDSLVEYVDRFKTDATVIFADINEDRIVAVLDYHGKGESAVAPPRRRVRRDP